MTQKYQDAEEKNVKTEYVLDRTHKFISYSCEKISALTRTQKVICYLPERTAPHVFPQVLLHTVRTSYFVFR